MTYIRNLILGALCAGLLAAPAAAQPGPPDHDSPRQWEQLAGRLALSDVQQQAIRAIRDDAQTKNRALRKDLARLQNELEGEMLADAPNQGTVLALVEKIGDVRTQMQANRIKARLAVRKELTPEQRDQLILMEGRGPRHQFAPQPEPRPRGPRGERN